MSIQVANTNSLYLTVTRDGINSPVLKSLVSMEIDLVDTNVVNFYWHVPQTVDQLNHYPMDWNDVTSPVVVSAADLMSQINLMIAPATWFYTRVWNDDLSAQITGGTAVFNTSDSYITGTLRVYYNGIRLTLGTDYTETTSTSFTLTFTPPAGADQKLITDYEH